MIRIQASLLKLGRNLLGVSLIVLGVLLGFIPVLPGVVLVVLGIALLDFPGKRWLLRRVERIPLFVRLRRHSPAIARLWKQLLRERRPRKIRLTSEKPFE